MDDLLVIYASFGEGHKITALSLKEYFKCECKDLLDFCPPLIKKIYRFSYLFITDYFPFLWKIIFFFTYKKKLIDSINKLHFFLFPLFLEYLKKIKPKSIFLTHFFPIFLSSSLKEKLKFKLNVIVTDIRVHPLWVDKSVDNYFVVSDETRQDLVRLGIEKEKITVGFFPFREGFLKEFPKEELKKKFSLPHTDSILFVSSIRGKIPFLKEILPELLERFNVFIIYGKNKKLKKYLENFKSPSLRYFFFYEKIWEIMSLTFLIITKPGGLTLFEGIYKKNFFIFPLYIPGQEEKNLKWAVKKKIAKRVGSGKEILEAIDYFLDKKDQIYPLRIRNIYEILDSKIR
jgi:processive 1,2-diacylglycerol beta-glucosyltransferase